MGSWVRAPAESQKESSHKELSFLLFIVRNTTTVLIIHTAMTNYIKCSLDEVAEMVAAANDKDGDNLF